MSKDQFMDDMTRMFGSAMQNMGTMKQEAENVFHQQIQSVLQKMDVVPREEFEAMRELVQRLEGEQKELSARLEAMEGKNSPKSSKKAKKA